MPPRALGREIHAENQNFEKSRDKFMKTLKMNADWVKTRAQRSRVACVGALGLLLQVEGPGRDSVYYVRFSRTCCGRHGACSDRVNLRWLSWCT